MKVPWDKPLDLLFIDTLHTYDQATAELARYGPYVRSGGVVIMHDFQNSGVRKAAEDYASLNPNIRLYRFWNNNGLAVMFHPWPLQNQLQQVGYSSPNHDITQQWNDSSFEDPSVDHLSSPNVPVGLGDKVEEHAGCDAPDGEDPSKL